MIVSARNVNPRHQLIREERQPASSTDFHRTDGLPHHFLE
jgi:hypothetical protein